MHAIGHDTSRADLLDLDPRDHLVGAPETGVTIVLYGDFQCPFTANAAAEVRELRATDGPETFAYVFRQFPLAKHPDAYAAALASEIAATQGKFWEMHDLLFARDGDLHLRSLRACAAELGIDAETFGTLLRDPDVAERVERDLRSGASLGVTGTPTFFVNGERKPSDHSVELFRSWVAQAHPA
ncbi:MAG: Na(+)/H(+) antiporter nhaA [Thermoleophilia bacterium]|nr:Na(+)/H(+) antiporter nhaA [Thermoleophilia bacterium]